MKHWSIEDAQTALIYYLKNDGRFSVLVIGPSGCGKSHWINHHISVNRDKVAVSRQARLLNGYSEDQWVQLLKEADDWYLVIKNVEELDRRSQELLFDLMSTTQGGLYGLSNEKKYAVRIVFTTTMSLESLLQTTVEREGLTIRFFSRIAQLVLEFPSLSDDITEIWTHFCSVWANQWMGMNPPPTLPEETILKTWLSTQRATFQGNFRDLQKVAINWHQISQMNPNFDSKQILKKLEAGYKHYATPHRKKDSLFTFTFDRKENYDEMISRLNGDYVDWVESIYGDLDSAAPNVGRSAKHMRDRWRRPKNLK